MPIMIIMYYYDYYICYCNYAHYCLFCFIGWLESVGSRVVYELDYKKPILYGSVSRKSFSKSSGLRFPATANLTHSLFL